MKCIDEIPATELKGKRVLVRADFNVPIGKDGEVADAFRLLKGWETIRYLSERGARVIIVTHVGRDPEESSAPVARALQRFGRVIHIADLTGAAAQSAVKAMKDGEVILLENVRRDAREIANDPSFSQELAALAEVYVGDAFAAAHRPHASIVGVPALLPHYAGFLIRDEVKELQGALTPSSPSLAILGGAKFETKAPLIRLLLKTYDHLFVTGALANDVFKARGLPTGRSLISKELPSTDILGDSHFLAPVDVTVESSAEQARVKKPNEVVEEDKIVDIGPDTVAMLAPHLESAKFILWNGPTGIYEDGYLSYTAQIAEIAAKSGAKIVIGGGDTIAALEQSGTKMGDNAFLSTGGGAMLEYLLNGTLPGIEALE